MDKVLSHLNLNTETVDVISNLLLPPLLSSFNYHETTDIFTTSLSYLVIKVLKYDFIANQIHMHLSIISQLKMNVHTVSELFYSILNMTNIDINPFRGTLLKHFSSLLETLFNKCLESPKRTSTVMNVTLLFISLNEISNLPIQIIVRNHLKIIVSVIDKNERNCEDNKSCLYLLMERSLCDEIVSDLFQKYHSDLISSICFSLISKNQDLKTNASVFLSRILKLIDEERGLKINNKLIITFLSSIVIYITEALRFSSPNDCAPLISSLLHSCKYLKKNNEQFDILIPFSVCLSVLNKCKNEQSFVSILITMEAINFFLTAAENLDVKVMILFVKQYEGCVKLFKNEFKILTLILEGLNHLIKKKPFNGIVIY